MPIPSSTRVLVLNNDRTPLNVVEWKNAFKRTLTYTRCEHCKKGVIPETREPCPYCLGRGKLPPAEVIEYYDLWIRDSAGREYPVPAVICNRHYVRKPYAHVTFSRINVFKRDDFTCQYCGKKMRPHALTLDHVVPRSMWKGKDTSTNWYNIVTACQRCNHLKDDRTPEQAEMSLRKMIKGNLVYYKKPKPATQAEIVLGLAGERYPPEWETYVAHLLSSRKLKHATV